MSRGKELEDWGEREGLSHDIIIVLLDQGFNTLSDLRRLTLDDITKRFQETGLLIQAKVLALRKAMRISPYEPHDPGFTNSPRETSQLKESPNHPQEASYRPASQQEGYPTQGDGRSQSDPHHDELHLTTAMDATSTVDQQSGGNEENKFRFLLVGKTGNGKSTTGNTILGEKKFDTALRFGSVTSKCDLQRSDRAGVKIDIMDSPGLYDTNRTQDEIAIDIVQAVACMHPGPNAVLYVVRLGRYTAEEYGAYQRLKVLFDDNITNYIIIIFTGGDELEETSLTFDDVMLGAPKEISEVMKECGDRKVIFNNKASKPAPQLEQLLDTARLLMRQNGGPYLCPKYKKIGEGLEEEVARRLAVVDKKELERQKYVQELEQKTKAAEEVLHKMTEKMEKKDAQRQRKMEEDERKRKQEVELLMKQMEAQKRSEERTRQEDRELMRKKFDEQKRIDDERLQEERASLRKEMEAQKLREEKRRQAESESWRNAMEEQKLSEEKRRQEERESWRNAMEEQKLSEEKRRQEERELLRKQMEEQKLSADQRLQAETQLIKKQMEEQKQSEEKRQKEEKELLKKKKKELKQSEEKRRQEEKELMRKQMEEQKQSEERRRKEEKELLKMKKKELKQKEDKRLQEENELLKKQLEEQKQSEERRRKEKKQLKARMEKEHLQLVKQVEEQRRQERAEMDRKEKEKRELEYKREKEEREARDRTERRHLEEMRRMQDNIAQNEEPGFFESVLDVISTPIMAVWDKITSWFS